MLDSEWKELIHHLLHVILGEIKMAQQDIDRLRQAVARQTTVQASMTELLRGVSKQIRDNADDPTELQAIAAQLDQNTDAMAAAVQENTPASGQGGTSTTTSA